MQVNSCVVSWENLQNVYMIDDMKVYILLKIGRVILLFLGPAHFISMMVSSFWRSCLACPRRRRRRPWLRRRRSRRARWLPTPGTCTPGRAGGPGTWSSYHWPRSCLPPSTHRARNRTSPPENSDVIIEPASIFRHSWKSWAKMSFHKISMLHYLLLDLNPHFTPKGTNICSSIMGNGGAKFKGNL